MRTKIGCAAVLLGAMGVVTGATASADNGSLAGKRGLSPIISIILPYVPAQDAPIVLMQAANPDVAQQPDYLLKACTEFSSGGGGPVDPAGMLAVFLENHQGHSYITPEVEGTIKLTLLEGTKHGQLIPLTSGSGRLYYKFIVEPGYMGKDKAVFMAEFEGKHYKVVVNFVITEGINENDPQCPQPELIKLNKPSSGSSGFDLNGITVNIADLPGGAVGQTIGTNITLDDNAARNGWFIDTTPSDNSEFLPTSNPNEWVAKAGSDAAGKMDMLSVLLHEYGHALGIEHSADSGDYMGTTLTVGVRRLPSATELALMQQLIGQAKDGLASVTGSTPTPTLMEQLAIRLGWQTTPAKSPVIPLQGGGSLPLDLPISLGGLAFAGLLRPNRYGSLSPSTELRTGIDLAAPATQYEAAANATFTNLDTATAWQTQGSVDITPSSFDTSGRTVVSSATLNEVSTAQTRLSQVFMLNDKDRYLSFTLAGAPLPNPLPEGEGANGAASGSGYGPSDAFEVTLLDASTGGLPQLRDGVARIAERTPLAIAP